MSDLPENLRYTKEHEWARSEENGSLTIGITHHAQESLGDITFVELPEVGSRFTEGEVFGVVESVKAASDLFAPVAGEVVAVNEALDLTPEMVNETPYAEGWMIKVKPDDPEAINSLLLATEYSAGL
ncbi:MAG: glycine cleavage system protein H [Opitutae bacterium]|nr:glycine cleavage system protein H [Opitutae bacterium]|tara:strand:+ start:39773 stop:40153 length:381 start_codon:yes stop_codon:yes gene_type:complete